MKKLNCKSAIFNINLIIDPNFFIKETSTCTAQMKIYLLTSIDNNLFVSWQPALSRPDRISRFIMAKLQTFFNI